MNPTALKHYFLYKRTNGLFRVEEVTNKSTWNKENCVKKPESDIKMNESNRIFIESLVTKPLDTLLKDIFEVVRSGKGQTSLYPNAIGDNSRVGLPFIDDIVEEKLITNHKTQELYVVYRIFINSLDENRYDTIGWLINEGIPVCNLCRKPFKASSSTSSTDKFHCYACGNLFCLACCCKNNYLQGMEDCGPLRVCNLCDYGQEVVIPVSYRKTTRFEITNLPEFSQGLTREIQVFDNKNENNQELVNSIAMEVTVPNPGKRKKNNYNTK
jgi:hypothetical protein